MLYHWRLQHIGRSARTKNRRFCLRHAVFQSATSVLCHDDKGYHHCCSRCRIDQLEELAKQTVIQMICQDRKMAGVMHMVCTLHTVGSRTGYSLMAVYPR